MDRVSLQIRLFNENIHEKIVIPLRRKCFKILIIQVTNQNVCSYQSVDSEHLVKCLLEWNVQKLKVK